MVGKHVSTWWGQHLFNSLMDRKDTCGSLKFWRGNLPDGNTVVAMLACLVVCFSDTDVTFSEDQFEDSFECSLFVFVFGVGLGKLTHHHHVTLININNYFITHY